MTKMLSVTKSFDHYKTFFLLKILLITVWLKMTKKISLTSFNKLSEYNYHLSFSHIYLKFVLKFVSMETKLGRHILKKRTSNQKLDFGIQRDILGFMDPIKFNENFLTSLIIISFFVGIDWIRQWERWNTFQSRLTHMLEKI